jgi:hypothetical protein
MPNDSLYAYVLGQLGASKGKLPSVARGSGIPYRTLEKIARGETSDPGVLTIEKLARYFRKKAAE